MLVRFNASYLLKHVARTKKLIILQSDIKLYASNENQEQRDDKNKQYNPYYITSVAPNIVHCGGEFISEVILSNDENNDVRIFISSDTVCSPDFNKPTK